MPREVLVSGERGSIGQRNVSRSAAALLSAVSLTGVTTVAFGATSASADSAYTATASARLVGVDVIPGPSLLTGGALFDGGESVAQAQVDSLGISRAFAANTFPSTTVMTLNGTLGLLICQRPPPFPPCGTIPTERLPTYPLSASSSYPLRQSDSQGGGPYRVSATSSRTASSGTAADGATQGLATTALDPDSGDVVSRAESSVAGLKLGDSVALYGVHASAEASRAPSGKLTTKSRFAVSSMTVLGHQVAVTPKGLTLVGQQVPLPNTGAVLNPVLDALKAQGITIEPFPARALPNGLVSAGLRITATVNVPKQDPPPPIPKPGVGLNTVTVVLTLGGSSVSVTNVALPSFGGVAQPPVPGFSSQPPPTAALGTGGTAVSPPLVTGVSPPLVTGVSQGGGSPSTPVPDGIAAAPSASRMSWIPGIPVDASLVEFYPVLVLVGALLFGVARLFSVLEGKPK